MAFQDQSHIDRVRDALWSRSGNGASVMVGSGFSKNAERVILNAKEMPTWQDLADHFYDALYPQRAASGGGTHCRPAIDNVGIAQEYEAAFGRSGLHEALRRLVPNEAYRPGREHERLLELPWRDVYTTNWDTLLERAKDHVTERHYSTVTSKGGIPMAKGPRIVKLHGSLPEQFPLIATEEDYRTYPTNFAPFVNTVQQSMMETEFILLGFSGDDPNFLKWSGWVRDNLGSDAPKIYLAGWLGLSLHRRRMLENRNVVSIDLARHPQAQTWPKVLRHDRATDWLLRTLELGRPYDITTWPFPPSLRQDEVPSYLQPVETVRPDEPKAERNPPSVDGESVSSPDDVRDITDVWRHNRLLYPGWLTMPPFHRMEMQRNTESWRGSVLRTLPVMAPVERLRTIRELVWREEILLIPIYLDVLSAIHETLDSIDCQNLKINGTSAPSEDWISIREDWRNVAAAVVTAARFRFDRDAFEQALDALEPFQQEDPNVYHRLIHEQCLWSVYDRDFDELGELVTQWTTESSDPAWTMRKSALFWEAGHNDEARELLNNSIAAIKAMPPDDSSLASLSRESWATFLALDRDNRLTLLDRLKELVPMRCDPFEERQSITDGMGLDKPEEEPPAFDINRRTGTRERWTNYDPYEAAYRAVRLSEMAGLPPFTDNSSAWAGVLRRAADAIADYDPGLSVRLLVRACNGYDDETLRRILTRARVATIPPELTWTLAQVCMKALDHAEREAATRASATQRQFNAAAEVLSRLVIRLRPDHAETVLDKAVEFCRNPSLAKSFVDVTVRNLLARAWEALPVEDRQRKAMYLLNSELTGTNNIEPIVEYSWPDPAVVVADTKLVRTPENESQWSSAVDAISSGLAGNLAARRRAITRMIPVVRSNLLTENESQKIAAALWSERHTPEDGLPANSGGMYDWAFLIFPEPTPRLAPERFIAKWLPDCGDTEWQHKKTVEMLGSSPNGLNHDTADVDSRLWQIGQAIISLRRRENELTLSEANKRNLSKLVEIWAGARVPEFALPDHPLFARVGRAHQQRIRDVTSVLPAVLSSIDLTEPLAENLHSKTRALLDNQMPVYILAVGLIKIHPDYTQETATALRIGVTSDDYELATDAVSAIHHWLEEAPNPGSKIPQPPDDLVLEIGRVIASRRNTVITAMLRLAAWIFNNGQDHHKDAIQPLVEDGLRYLAQELRYDRQHDNPDDVPRKRLCCASLAAAMAQSGLHESPAVTSWLEIAREDPLPEVRNAVAQPYDIED